MADHITSSMQSIISSLLGKVFWVLLLLCLFRVGTYIPIPYVNASVFSNMVNNSNGGVLSLFNVFSGGAISRSAIFALNVMPYIVSSIIMQLIVSSFKSLSSLKNEGRSGQAKISFYTRLLSIFLCLFQAFFIVSGLEGILSDQGVSVFDGGLMEKLIAISTLLGGFFVVTMIGEKITESGFCNGISMIILIGILIEIPSSFSYIFSLSKVDFLSFLIVFSSIIALFFIVILCERSVKKIPITYPRHSVSQVSSNLSSSFIPLKINMAGVIPPIFAGAFLSFPLTISSFFSDTYVGEFLSRNLVPGKVLYMVFYSILIIFFCYFYNSFVFNVDDVTDNIKKSGGIVLGKRPGKATSEYLSQVSSKLTLLGAMYLCVVCIVPDFIRGHYYIPFSVGGTAILIIVNVILDTVTQVQSYVVSNMYGSNTKKKTLFSVNMSNRKRS